VTGRPPKATVTGVRLTRRTMHFDASESLRALGLSPRPIRESLADAVHWLRVRGELRDHLHREPSNVLDRVDTPSR